MKIKKISFSRTVLGHTSCFKGAHDPKIIEQPSSKQRNSGKFAEYTIFFYFVRQSQVEDG